MSEHLSRRLLSWDLKTPHVGYKYVDADDARFIEGGSFKLGTNFSYAMLEGSRADPLDSMVKLHGPSGGFTIEDPGKQPNLVSAAAALGVAVEPWAKNSTIEVTHLLIPQPVFIFCLSWHGSNKHLLSGGKPQAIFRVSDISRFGFFVREAAKDKLGPGKYRVVQYGQVEFDVTRQSPIGANPYLKGERFRQEKEVRIVWPRLSGALIDVNPTYVHAPAATRFLKRIA